MPNLNDIVTIAEALEKSPVVVVPDRCVNVRNRNATCRKCLEVCSVEAIDVHANEIHLDAKFCMACGACTAVCPTEALVSVTPLDADLAQSTASAAAANGGQAVIACARMAAKKIADPERFAQVPCLARIDDSLPLSLVAHGASGVCLVDGTCGTCKYGAVDGCIEATIASVNGLLEAHGSQVRVQRASEFPENLLVEDTQGMYGSTRRGFFSDAVDATKDTVMTAARTTIEQELGYANEEPNIGERLRVSSKTGQMPRISVPRHDVAINALDAIGAPVVDRIESRLFGTVDINMDACNACGMCAVFCPTGALKRDLAEKMSEPLHYLEFSASDCVQCGMCVDVCWKKALTLSSAVAADELYDFEPRTFHMKGVPPKKSLFG